MRMKEWGLLTGGKVRSVLMILAISISLAFYAADGLGSDNEDLTQLSLEDLMNIRITSASKKSQPLSEAASAVFVITQEDIRRSGVTRIADALRMVPGLQVAKLDANKWAVTARGSNGRFANKLLVLIDGRSVYTPLYSGVIWENIDTVLEDIDRIEVIRGPGASLWGANAVNGVINIITKSAEDAQGVLASGLAGTAENGNLSLRYGGQIGSDTPFRVYVKGFDHDGAVDADGDDTADDWRYLQGGFRLDHRSGMRDQFTLQGDIFDGTNGETINQPIVMPPYSQTYDNDHGERGHNLLARWTRTLSSLSEFSLQVYYDHNQHHMHVGTAESDTFDMEFQHRFPLGNRHDVTWGLGYRLYQDDYISALELELMDPSRRDISIFNAFLQDEISFIDKRLLFTLGSKLEYNEYTHLEIQPNARLLWKPNDRHSLWTAVSRAVRTPSRVERDSKTFMAAIPPSIMEQPPPVVVAYFGTDDFESEALTAYEMGYRVQATDRLTVDAAIYYNDYDGLRETATGAPILFDVPFAYVLVPVTSTNETSGAVYGFELAADWRPTEWLRFQPAYTYMENKIDYSENDIIASQDPRYQLSLRTSLDLPWDLELDLWYRHIAKVSDTIDGYDTLDARIGWRYGDHLEISVVGQNLFDSHHAEIEPEALHTVGTAVQRGVYGKVVWRFN